MKTIVLLLLLILGQYCFAFQYERQNTPPRLVINAALSRFDQMGYKTLFSQDRAFLGVQQVFYKNNLKSFVLLKWDLKLTQKSEAKQYLKVDESDYLLNFNIMGFQFVAYFYNFEQNEFSELKKTLIQSYSFLDFIYSQTVTKSFALDSSCDTAGPNQELSQVASKTQSDNSFEAATSCIMSALEGVWASTGGSIVDGAQAVLNFFSSPVESFKKVANTIKNVSNIVTDIKGALASLGDWYHGLSEHVKMMIACSLGGSLTADGVLALVTGGAGAGVLVLNLLKKIKLLEKMKTLLKLISNSKFLAENKNLSDTFGKFVQKVLTGKMDDEKIQDIERLMDAKLDHYALEAMECSI